MRKRDSSKIDVETMVYEILDANMPEPDLFVPNIVRTRGPRLRLRLSPNKHLTNRAR